MKSNGENSVTWLLIIIVLLVLGGGIQLPVTGTTAPFTLPDGVPVAAIVIYDGSPQAVQALTTAQALVTTDTGIGSARGVVEAAGGKFRLVSTTPGEYEENWVRAAYAKKGVELPWIVAAGKRGGINQGLPPSVRGVDVVEKLKIISGK